MQHTHARLNYSGVGHLAMWMAMNPRGSAAPTSAPQWMASSIPSISPFSTALKRRNCGASVRALPPRRRSVVARLQFLPPCVCTKRDSRLPGSNARAPVCRVCDGGKRIIVDTDAAKTVQSTAIPHLLEWSSLILHPRAPCPTAHTPLHTRVCC